MNSGAPAHAPAQSYLFILKLQDRPGGLERIAAIFAQRGISLTTTLGNNGLLDAQNRATVLVTFTAAPRKKEILRRALSRLSPVVSLIEYASNDARLRKTAMVRIAASAANLLRDDKSSSPETLQVEPIETDVENGEEIYLLTGTPGQVDAALTRLQTANALGDATQTIIAL